MPLLPSDAILTEVRAQLRHDLDPTAGDWLGASTVEQTVDAWFAEQCRRCENLAWGETFAHHCPVPGARPADYLQRWIEVDGAWLLVGIRMRGTDTAHAFVDLVAWSRAVPLDRAVEAACDACAVFAPTRARFRGRVTLPSATHLTVELDQVYVAARTETMARASDAALEGCADVDDGLSFVHAAYQEWTERRPWIAERVQVVTRGQLAAACGAATAWWIREGDDRVGLIATVPGPDREWSGHLVLEEVVAPAFAGRRYAARAQRAVAAELVDRGVPVLFGTIDAMNAPSRRTAGHAGRHEVGALWWLEPSR